MPVTPDGTHYHLSGKAGGPAVALVHGLGLTQDCWQWLRPALEPDFQVVSLDLLGHGASAKPRGRVSLRDLSDQLAALLRHLAIPRAAIIGFSLGGMVARRFAQDYRAECSALVLLHSPHLRTAAAQDAILARVAQAANQGPSATVEAALDRWFTPAFRAARPDVMALVRGWVLGNDPAVYPDLYRVLAEGVDEVIAPAPPLTCPTLVITADEDFGNGPEMSAAIAAEIDGSECLILPGLRHMALAEDPDAINQPVRAFLRRTLAP